MSAYLERISRFFSFCLQIQLFENLDFVIPSVDPLWFRAFWAVFGIWWRPQFWPSPPFHREGAKKNSLFKCKCIHNGSKLSSDFAAMRMEDLDSRMHKTDSPTSYASTLKNWWIVFQAKYVEDFEGVLVIWDFDSPLYFLLLCWTLKAGLS